MEEILNEKIKTIARNYEQILEVQYSFLIME